MISQSSNIHLRPIVWGIVMFIVLSVAMLVDMNHPLLSKHKMRKIFGI